ncbi:hypothetical protein PP935_gp064 [Rhizobium phage RHph_N34]|uniref:Uncharacterized protein n=1 Tax=Rhizobium phage RHph_N34 TaxID=2509586 RepID=A0A7S5UYF0_9CAUD|nr:hypothetical protein PP935_gp064 [Rhizobium phage RHph_N34]QIG73839.1 hypothetical protein EVC06_064 [Rhizobium phage RHph_N34]
MKTCTWVLKPATLTTKYELCGEKCGYRVKYDRETGRKHRVHNNFCDKHLEEEKKFDEMNEEEF